MALAFPQEPSLARFNVAWRPEADAPFAKIRTEVEPYALSKVTTPDWTRKKALDANAAWKRSPSSSESWYRAMLWEKVLLTAHYNDVTPEDAKRRGELQVAIRNWERVPPSSEFSRLVVSSTSDPRLLPLATRLLAKYPGDGLLVGWSFRNFFSGNPSSSVVKKVNAEASAFYSKHPNVWIARLTWAISPWIVTRETTLKDQLEIFRELDRRFRKLRATHTFGKREQEAIDEWSANLPNFIKGYEDLVRKGRGGELQKDFRG